MCAVCVKKDVCKLSGGERRMIIFKTQAFMYSHYTIIITFFAVVSCTSLSDPVNGVVTRALELKFQSGIIPFIFLR